MWNKDDAIQYLAEAIAGLITEAWSGEYIKTEEKIKQALAIVKRHNRRKEKEGKG